MRQVGACRMAVLASALVASASWATGAIAVHPLGLPDEDSAAGETLRAEFQRLLRESGVEQVEPARVEKYLRGVEGNSCSFQVDSNRCLAALAKATGASRTLTLSVSLFPVIISGMVVGVNGQSVVLPIRQTRVEERDRTEVARREMGAFLKDLLQADQSHLVSELVPEPAPEPTGAAVAPTVQGTASAPRGTRLPAYALLAAGAVGLGVGIGLHVDGAAARRQQEQFKPGETLTPGEREELLGVSSRARSRALWVFGRARTGRGLRGRGCSPVDEQPAPGRPAACERSSPEAGAGLGGTGRRLRLRAAAWTLLRCGRSSSETTAVGATQA